LSYCRKLVAKLVGRWVAKLTREMGG
jgi:hypothetical protein